MCVMCKHSQAPAPWEAKVSNVRHVSAPWTPRLAYTQSTLTVLARSSNVWRNTDDTSRKGAVLGVN